MKLRGITYLGLFLLSALFQNCGTKKNTFIHRGYHNMTARFNGYYWSSEAIKEGVFKIEGNNKDNYEKLLPVYVMPTNESAKTTFPDFDKAIKKSSLVIQRHTIKDKKDNEIPTAGKWIDNNWVNIGISRFYKREFFSGIEAFDYVVRTYKTKDKYKALLWEAKALCEIGSVSTAEPIIALLHNDKKVPKKIKSQIPALRGDYFIKRGLYKEAIGALTEATNQPGILRKGLKKKERARYAFIVAQLYEEEKNPRKARDFYERALSLKPAYDMVFYANIKLARLVDTKRGGAEKTKIKLLRMTKDTKNSEYLDVIYYTLGEIEEKERHEDKAIEYYTKSAATSVSNINQKALAYLKLGDIYFEQSNYTLSEGYYDSTVTVLPKDHPNYNNIVNRKNTLSTLVGYIRTIQREDSLQKLANMSEADRNKAIDKIIAKIEDDEEKKREQMEAIKSQNQNPLTNNSGLNETLDNGNGGWYFYNQTTISFGIADFAKRWGNRKLEDNWRRSQKGMVIDNSDNTPDAVTTKTTTANNKNNTKAPKDPKKTREYYLKGVPLTDTLMKISHNKIIEAEYLLGSTYKEELNNNKKSIAAFEDLNRRYPEHKYRLQSYYQLYRTYLADKNQERSDFYKDKLLNDYPKSEYAKLIKNPKYAEELNAQRGEVEKFYENTFDAYASGNYAQSLSQSEESVKKFGKTDFSAKFELLRAMSIGRLKGPDSLMWAINEFLILYPNSEVTPRANEILNAIKRQQNPGMFKSGNDTPQKKDTTQLFSSNLDVEHFVVILTADDPKVANPYKSAIDNFNREYYSNKVFSISSNLFGTTSQMIIVKSFPDAREAYNYLENLKGDSKIYVGNLKKELFTFLIISAENLPAFYKKGDVNVYKTFFDEAYKSVIQQPK